MRMVDLIEKKRDGGVLTDDEIRFIIRGFTDGSIPDYQMSAFAMTVFYKGMTDHETAVLTDAMMHSGDTVDLSRFGDKSVDKHSTGGVGDKTTLIVAPIVSSLGGKMAKMSGRGLGHTGGTVDKLESIPGYQTTLSADAFMRQVEQVGVAVIGQSGNLTPADKKLYALRDVTATIDSLPLITSSIMSKKLAAGAHSIVLDVKIGSGAFMKTLEDGQKLAESMVRIGRACGRNVVAVMSNMDIPLGFYIGNALEVREAVEVLQGHGCPDLTGVCITLAANMLHLCNGWPIEEATKQAQEAISSGRAFEQMKRWIAAQGGDAAVLDNVSLLPQASVQYELKAPQAGYIHHMDAQKIGESSAILGAGRKTKDDVIDPAAGIVLKEKTGAKVEQGQTLAVLHTDRPETLADAERVFLEAHPLGRGRARGAAAHLRDRNGIKEENRDMSDVIVIGVAGGTGSGKTTLVKALVNRFGDNISVLSHDNYYKRHDEMSYEERTHLNYDCPDAFDTDMMIDHLRMLKNGQAIDCPTYDYTIHNRAEEVLHIEPRRVIVVEGIMIFVNKTLCDEMNIRIFVDADADVRLCRRIRRDVKKRGRSIDSVIDQYLTTVKPMHELYVEPSKKNAHIIVPEGGKNLIALEMIINRIQRHIDASAD